MKNHKLDEQMLMEAYDQILEEGLFDRLKARGSQAMGAVQGAGQQLKGKAQQLQGDVYNKVADAGAKAFGGDITKSALAQKGQQLQQTGKKDVTQGARKGDEAKYRSYIANSTKTIAKDLEKLGMEVSDENQLILDIQNAITKNLKQTTARGQFRTQSGQLGAKVI